MLDQQHYQTPLIQKGFVIVFASSSHYNKRMKDVALCLAKNIMPIQTVDKKGFRRMIKAQHAVKEIFHLYFIFSLFNWFGLL